MYVFVYLPLFKVVVCSVCRHAILPSHIDAHLKNKVKHNIVKEQREQVIQEIERVDGLIRERNELNPLVSRMQVTRPFQNCKSPQRMERKCQFQDSQDRPCKFVACQVPNIQQHCREKHGWSNPQKKGRQRKGEVRDVPWRSGLHCQHFLSVGREHKISRFPQRNPVQPCRPGTLVWRP